MIAALVTELEERRGGTLVPLALPLLNMTSQVYGGTASARPGFGAGVLEYAPETRAFIHDVYKTPWGWLLPARAVLRRFPNGTGSTTAGCKPAIRVFIAGPLSITAAARDALDAATGIKTPGRWMMLSQAAVVEFDAEPQTDAQVNAAREDVDNLTLVTYEHLPTRALDTSVGRRTVTIGGARSWGVVLLPRPTTNGNVMSASAGGWISRPFSQMGNAPISLRRGVLTMRAAEDDVALVRESAIAAFLNSPEVQA